MENLIFCVASLSIHLENIINAVQKYHLISWCGNLDRHSFRRVSGDSPETVQKLYLSTKFPHQEIRWNYGVLHSSGALNVQRKVWDCRNLSLSNILNPNLVGENCHNSRISDNIDMKLGPVTQLDKRNKTTSKKLTITSCRQTVVSLSYFRFMANLEQSRSRIPDS